MPMDDLWQLSLALGILVIISCFLFGPRSRASCVRRLNACCKRADSVQHKNESPTPTEAKAELAGANEAGEKLSSLKKLSQEPELDEAFPDRSVSDRPVSSRFMEGLEKHLKSLKVDEKMELSESEHEYREESVPNICMDFARSSYSGNSASFPEGLADYCDDVQKTIKRSQAKKVRTSTSTSGKVDFKVHAIQATGKIATAGAGAW
eukprot:g6309.t1